MFKILSLQPHVDSQLQSIQDQWEIQAVTNLGTDSSFNHYLLVQYDTPTPGTVNPPLSGSVPLSSSASQPKKGK